MNMSEVRKKIEKENLKFGEYVRRSDTKAISGLYTDGASLLPVGMKSIEGRKAIEQFWGNTIKSMGLKDASLKTVELVESDDTVTERGEYVLKFNTEGKATEDKGKYIVVWKNTPAGWKLHWDIWTTNMPQK